MSVPPFGSPHPTEHTAPGDPGYVTDAPPSTGRAAGWFGVGVLYLVALWQLVIPTVWTFAQSLSAGNPVTGGGGFVGLENWSVLMPRLVPALGFSIVAVLPVTIAAAALGLVIGAAMTPHQRLARPTRVVVGVLGALFVPLGIGLAAFMAGQGAQSPADSRSFIIVTVTLAALPLLTAAFATAFAFVLAGAEPGRGVLLVLVVGVAGALALAPQLFDLPYALTGGGPQEATTTPMLMAYRHGFQYFEFGPGAAASSMTFLLAGVLGLGAMAVLLRGRRRLEVLDGPARPGAAGSVAGVVGAVLAALGLIAALLLHWPLITGGASSGPDGVPVLGAIVATWGGPGLGTLLQVAIALLGGWAIGWCRPAGRHSLWLLLPLAPWLFVGPTPFMLHSFSRSSDLGLLNSLVGMLPQSLVVVGAVTLMALLFSGLRERAQPGRGRVVGAAAAGAAAVLLLTQAQSLLPGLVVNTDPTYASAPMLLIRLIASYGLRDDALLGMLYPIPMVLLVAGLGVLAQLGLARVVAVRD